MAIVKLGQLAFSRGIAKLGGQNFTGVLKHIAKNGDHMEMRYFDGVLQDVKRAGIKNYVKQYTDTGVFTYAGDKLSVGARNLNIRGKVGELTSVLDKSFPDSAIRKDGAGNIISGYILDYKTYTNDAPTKPIKDYLRVFRNGNSDAANIRTYDLHGKKWVEKYNLNFGDKNSPRIIKSPIHYESSQDWFKDFILGLMNYKKQIGWL